MRYVWVRTFAILSVVIAVLYLKWDTWIAPDRRVLPRDIAFAVFSGLMLWLVLWLEPRWKYYERARAMGVATLAGIYGSGGLGIGFWTSGSRVSAAVMAILCVWGLVDLIRQVTKGEMNPGNCTKEPSRQLRL